MRRMYLLDVFFCVKDKQTFYKCGNIKSEKYDTPVAYKCNTVCKDKVSTI